MDRLQHRALGILGLVALLAACTGQGTAPLTAVLRTTSSEELPTPAKNGPKIAPRSFDATRDLLEQTAAIVEGEVFDVSHSFDDCAGPRTRVFMRNARSLLGSEVPSELELKVFGGPLPNGLWMEASELPRFALGSRYLVFLRNTDWTYAPVLGSHAYRRETIAGKQLLIDQEGRAVTGFTNKGVEAATDQLTPPVGLKRRGIEAEAPKTSPQPAAGGGLVSSRTDGGSLRPKDGTSSVPGRPLVSGLDLGSPRRFGPSAAEIAHSGRYDRPPVAATSPDALRRALTPDQFVGAIRQVADQENIRIAGVVELNPLWRCWSMTPEPNLGNIR